MTAEILKLVGNLIAKIKFPEKIVLDLNTIFLYSGSAVFHLKIPICKRYIYEDVIPILIR